MRLRPIQKCIYFVPKPNPISIFLMRRELFPHVIRVLRELAEFVHCQPEDLVLLPNATTGLNTVIQNLSLAPGDTIYMLDVGYGSVKKMAQVTCAKAGATVVQGELKFPIR